MYKKLEVEKGHKMLSILHQHKHNLDFMNQEIILSYVKFIDCSDGIK